MSSKAYEKFSKTLKRCEVLLDTYDKIKSLDQACNIMATKDIIRGAVVIAVSSLDAYVTDVFSEKFITYIKKHGVDDNLAKLLYEAGLDTKAALELITMDRPYRRIRTFIDVYYSKSTTQKYNVIDDLFKLYHLPKLTENAERRSGRIKLRRSVEILIERRHEIAHNGDYNRHGKINDISSETVYRRINDLEILVSNMDFIICNKIS